MTDPASNRYRSALPPSTAIADGVFKNDVKWNDTRVVELHEDVDSIATNNYGKERNGGEHPNATGKGEDEHIDAKATDGSDQGKIGKGVVRDLNDSNVVDTKDDKMSKRQRVDDIAPMKERSNNSLGDNGQTDTLKTSGATETSTVDTKHDVCSLLNLKNGDRLEVQWNVESTSDDTTSITRWWGATLIINTGTDNVDKNEMYTFTDSTAANNEGDEHGDNNDHCDTTTADAITVPTRILEYDPYPEGGYPDQSVAKVAFLTNSLVYDIEHDATCIYRLEGSMWEPTDDDMTEAASGTATCASNQIKSLESPSSTSATATSSSSPAELEIPFDGTYETLQTIVETILSNVFQQSTKVQNNLTKLSQYQQGIIATKIQRTKELFTEKLWEQCCRMDACMITNKERQDGLGRGAENSSGSKKSGMNMRKKAGGEKSSTDCGIETKLSNPVVITPEHVKLCMEQVREALVDR